MSYVLAIDQGTTSTRAIIFDKDLEIVASSQKEIEQFYPFSGWVEHDLEEIYSSVLYTLREAIKKAKIQGYEGEACGECGNFTLVRNGTCMKCNTCGSTSGCS